MFQDDPALDPVRILLATDAASEGIDLQNHCHRLLHWEIPWNPNRLEQRNGRIDRFRQPSPKVNVYHFVPKGWEDGDPGRRDGALEDELHFLWVAAKKTEQIREDLGSAGDVIAAQVEQKMLGKREDWQTVDVEIELRARVGRAELRVIRNLAADLQKLTDTLNESRGDLHLTPEAVEHVVRTALKLAFGRDLSGVPGPAGFPAPCFRIPELPAPGPRPGTAAYTTRSRTGNCLSRSTATRPPSAPMSSCSTSGILWYRCACACSAPSYGPPPARPARPGCTGSPPASSPRRCCASRPSSATSAWL